jgi:hypothetical protein
MKILPGRVRREGKGRAILYYKGDRCQKTACDESFDPELTAEWLSRVEFRGQNNVNGNHPRQLLHQSRMFF